MLDSRDHNARRAISVKVVGNGEVVGSRDAGKSELFVLLRIGLVQQRS